MNIKIYIACDTYLDKIDELGLGYIGILELPKNAYPAFGISGILAGSSFSMEIIDFKDCAFVINKKDKRISLDLYWRNILVRQMFPFESSHTICFFEPSYEEQPGYLKAIKNSIKHYLYGSRDQWIVPIKRELC